MIWWSCTEYVNMVIIYIICRYTGKIKNRFVVIAHIITSIYILGVICKIISNVICSMNHCNGMLQNLIGWNIIHLPAGFWGRWMLFVNDKNRPVGRIDPIFVGICSTTHTDSIRHHSTQVRIYKSRFVIQIWIIWKWWMLQLVGIAVTDAMQCYA